MRPKINRHLLKKGFFSGLSKGWGGFLWVIKILIPISLLTTVLAWSGWIEVLDFLLEPIMSLLGLPALAALPLIVGMLAGIYGGIAAMAALPFTKEQMTLMAIFILISHNLIQEGFIQGKSGIHPLKATLFRIASSIITVVLTAQFLDTTGVAPIVPGTSTPGTESFFALLQTWSMTTLYLAFRIFVIIMGILIILEILKSLGWITGIVRAIDPFLKALGLSQKVGIIWITGAVFGLIYGAAIIVEEVKEGHLRKEELEGLHLSIGINHSIVEDPALFLSLGLSPFWLWVPRLLMAMLAVRLLTLWQSIGSASRTTDN